MSVYSRLYEGEQDLAHLREIVVAAHGAGGHWHMGDLVWRLFLMSLRYDPKQNIRLWMRDDQVVGFAWFDPRDNSIDWQLAPGGPGCEEEVLAWTMERRGEVIRTQPEQTHGSLLTGAPEDDAQRIAFLERHGFVRAEPYYVKNVLSLVDDQAGPAVNQDFTIRNVTGEHEHAACAAVHREAFHPSRVTDESYLRLMRMPGYAADLDLVAVAPDGTFGAFCLCWVDPVNKSGEFEPVGSRPAFRRKGMARAVLFEGLRRMKARGCTMALVWTEGGNIAAQRLYESVGFRAAKRDYDYRLVICNCRGSRHRVQRRLMTSCPEYLSGGS